MVTTAIASFVLACAAQCGPDGTGDPALAPASAWSIVPISSENCRRVRSPWAEGPPFSWRRSPCWEGWSAPAPLGTCTSTRTG